MERLKRTRLTNDEAAELFSSDSYLTINKRLLQHYGPEVAVFLCNLTDKYRYFKERSLLEDGMFFQTFESQYEQTGMNDYKLRQCKKKLVEDEVLIVLRKGVPAKDWYRIDFEKLLNLLEPRRTSPLNFKGQGLENLKDYIKENKYKENKYNNIFIPPKNSSTGLKEKNKPYLPIAKYLAMIIQSKKKINKTSSVQNWTNDIRQLIETEGVEIGRVKKALTWYNEHINDEYCPVIESGSTLRTKFTKLENAMKRSQTKPRTNNIPKPVNAYYDETYQFREDDEEV